MFKTAFIGIQAASKRLIPTAVVNLCARIAKLPKPISLPFIAALPPTIVQLMENDVEETKPWFRWVPTSKTDLHQVEQKMLSSITSDYEQFFVKIDEDTHINTIKCGSGPPLVLIHGFAAGVGFWAGNIDDLAKEYTVYACDLVGFGRSSRPHKKFTSAEEAEELFVESINKWTSELKLDKFALLGHSLGGYISGCYSLKYPERINHLILADPWGIPKRPNDDTNIERRIPLRYRMAIKIIQLGSPLAILRASGPMGPGLVARFRPDIPQKFDHMYDDVRVVTEYIYHLNAQTPATGEAAFTALTVPIGYAKNPLIDRLTELDSSVPTSFIYGEDTWMDIEKGKILAKSIKAHVFSITDAGHHVYIDNWNDFNRTVLAVLYTTRQKEEKKSSR